MHGPYLKWPWPPSWLQIVLPVGSLPLTICSSTYKQGVCCHVCSHLCSRSPTLHSGKSLSTTESMSSIFVLSKKLNALILIYSIWPQASKQANIYTHMRNAVFATVGLTQAHPNHCKTLNCNTNLGLIECSAILGKLLGYPNKKLSMVKTI